MKKKSLLIASFVVIYDQLIKFIISDAFYYGQLKSIIPNFFYLTKVFNDGAAWSIFRGSRFLLIVISIVALFFLISYQNKFADKKKNIIAFGLIYGGLFGNLIDRIRLGVVIDYFKVILGTYEFPIFNFADVGIVCGFAILVYGIFKGEDKYGSKSR